MVRKALLAACCSVAIALGGVAVADVPATLVLKSGERISGDLIDLGGVGFTVRVNGEERRIAQEDVVLVDFVGGGQGLPDTELSQVRAGEHMIILKGSQSFHGNLQDISGTNPLQITFTTNGEQRTFASTDIGRIYLGNPGAAVPTTGTTPAPTTPAAPAGAITVTLAANQQWVPTNITVRKGDVVRFQTTGEIGVGGGDMAAVAGSKAQRFDAGAPLPRAYVGALIGRVGNGAPFAIGDQPSVQMPDSGPLFLGVNDSNPADNTGQFTVHINVPSRGIR